MRDEAPLSLSLTHSLPHCRRLARPASAQPIYLSHLLARWPAWHQMGKYYFFGNRARGRSLVRLNLPATAAAAPQESMRRGLKMFSSLLRAVCGHSTKKRKEGLASGCEEGEEGEE